MRLAVLPRCTITFTALTLACLVGMAHTAQPLSTFRDCATCPEMVILPASPAFAIGKYEITQAEWFAVTGERPAEFQGDRLPVETISWRDAQRFVEQLAAKTGRPYRLPTDTEWEYAARASGTTQYHFGDAVAELDQYAWFIDNANESTHPVGSKRPNAWGLHDMHGNVWEWTTACDEKKLSRYIRDCHRRYRGGSIANKASSLRITHIQSGGVGDRYFALGLRVALSLDQP